MKTNYKKPHIQVTLLNAHSMVFFTPTIPKHDDNVDTGGGDAE
ncbi:MAG: hypothetical protein SPI35_00055 [Porphyromonas sp.]|nr:hypothetical protein [Porphyromonas sp.]